MLFKLFMCWFLPVYLLDWLFSRYQGGSTRLRVLFWLCYCFFGFTHWWLFGLLKHLLLLVFFWIVRVSLCSAIGRGQTYFGFAAVFNKIFSAFLLWTRLRLRSRVRVLRGLLRKMLPLLLPFFWRIIGKIFFEVVKWFGAALFGWHFTYAFRIP